MDIDEEMDFWSKTIKIPKKQFWKSYIKKTSSQKINHNTYGHGTCNITVCKVELKRKIMAATDAILEAANAKLISIGGRSVAQW